MTPVICPICQADARYSFSGRDLMFDLYERHDYYACTVCGQIFMHPMPDAQTIASFYPPSYDIYEEDFRHSCPGVWKRALMRAKGYLHLSAGPLVRMLAPLAGRLGESSLPQWIQGGHLLDVGCGNGRYLCAMRALGWTVQGVEFSEDGVRVCRKANLPVHHGDIASAALPREHFDVITVRHVIEHIPDTGAFFDEIVSVLKPGGQLILATPNSRSLGRAWLGSNWFANEVPRHLCLFHPGSLARLAGRHGLSITSMYLETTPKIVLNSVDYVLNNRGRPSKRIRWRRMLARAYVWMAQKCGRGDVIHATLTKPIARPPRHAQSRSRAGEGIA